jgi:hypothetical protein
MLPLGPHALGGNCTGPTPDQTHRLDRKNNAQETQRKMEPRW